MLMVSGAMMEIILTSIAEEEIRERMKRHQQEKEKTKCHYIFYSKLDSTYTVLHEVEEVQYTLHTIPITKRAVNM